MSYNLRLLVLENVNELLEISLYPLDQLEVDQDYRIFGQLFNFFADCLEDGVSTICKITPLPAQLWIMVSIDSESIEKTRTNPYGDELGFMYAKDMKKLKLPKDVSCHMRAVKAFIDELADDTPIVLYLH